MYRQSEIIVKQQYLLHMFSQYSELRPTIGLDRLASLRHPSKFQRVSRLGFALLQRRRSPKANQTLHDAWPSPGLAHYIYTFRGSCRMTEFCPVQNSLYVQVLRSPILAALLYGTPAAGVSQTLRHATRNEITELSQRVPPIFGWVAITLGIGPHSSTVYFDESLHKVTQKVQMDVIIQIL